MRAIQVSERGTLVCIECRVEKPTSQFYRSPAWVSGFRRRCKACSAPRDRAQHSRPEVLERERDKRRADYAARGRVYEYTQSYNAARPRESRMWRSARERAHRDGLSFDIEVADIVIPERCPLLGVLIEPVKGARGAHARSPSLDRIDPMKGYVKGNVWVISYRANAIKHDATPEELERIAANLRRRLRQE